ncbi:ras-like protein rasD [Saccoglossus kowalevskii]|uniref:small monomeric GTPase n=1 Tax=Saccoglossus kowalevskii TaxID=10224 RepID=A0ABM0MQI2_SACKO|nr:PREDICTED: ras-related and estrogen-regulated growth inhibitor-like [Saccoglossus kowalevskii]
MPVNNGLRKSPSGSNNSLRCAAKANSNNNNNSPKISPRCHRTGKIIKPYHIVVLGAPGVGKSALTVRYLARRFLTEYASTLESSFERQVCLDDCLVNVLVTDTAGQDDDVNHFKRADGVLVVYDITNRSSFQKAKEILQTMKRELKSGNRPYPITLAGNKCDLEHLRTISWDEGRQLSREFECIGCTFIEVSAANGTTTVDVAFQGLLRWIVKSKESHGSSLGRFEKKSSTASGMSSPKPIRALMRKLERTASAIF